MDQSMCHDLHDSQSMDQLSGTAIEKSNAENQHSAPSNTRSAEVNSKDCWKGVVRYESSDSKHQCAGSQSFLCSADWTTTCRDRIRLENGPRSRRSNTQCRTWCRIGLSADTVRSVFQW